MDRCIFEDVVNKNEYNIPDKLNSDNIVIDIGAHIGSFSHLCLERGCGHVLAYEAWRPNYEIAKINLDKWIKKKRVDIFNLAVWKSDNEYVGFTQSTDPTNTGGGGIIFGGDVHINTISLDSILRHIQNVKLLKIDAEGSEYPILLSTKNIKKIEYICGECHTVPMYSFQYMKNYLKKKWI